MARSFYFDTEATMLSGSAVFSAAINSDATAFGLTEAQALAYGQINADLQSEMRAAADPLTRTAVAVAQKNSRIKSMQQSARGLVDIIRSTPVVTDAQLISLGLLPRAKRSRRNAPDAPSMVRVVSVAGRIVNIRVADKDSASGRSKAFGARAAQVFSYVGDAPPTDLRAYHFECTSSRTTAQIIFPNDVPSGATVWLSAKWVSARGESSIASVPMSFTLTGGAIGQAPAAMGTRAMGTPTTRAAA